MADIMILGCGFGTALSVLWHGAGHKITAYTKFSGEIEEIRRDGEHKRLLPGVKIPEGIEFTTDISLIKKARIIIFAIPSKFVREVAEEAAPYIPENAVIVNAGKGFAGESGGRFSEVIGSRIPGNPIVALTGPCHAEEVGRGIPTTVVSASSNRESAEYIQRTLQTNSFRIYVNDDLIGCELGGALKNPIALCCGIALGMGLGDNTVAALMTRGLAEIKRLGTALGAKWQTFTGLAGVGDLIVTCTSKHSRNHRAGILIGRGMSAEEAVKSVGTVEGYDCVRIALRLAREKGVDVPIFEQLYGLCYEGAKPKDALRALMERPQKDERERFWTD
ncbi:MAG: NAD(P)-dependent glycerol-3-phosphate dehydrogenase [Oscillospiraceae bacterium]|jgi:glycerol-3-phosphate dehydrogenase (NAD(P)+)|nr:NAD(P)-dependent glycerol-3-phosphate dehydrogenase [Oscillospiraceae bacterium]